MIECGGASADKSNEKIKPRNCVPDSLSELYVRIRQSLAIINEV